MKKRLAIVVIVIAVLFGGAVLFSREVLSPAEHRGQKSQFNKQQFSVDDPASPWIVVNKKRPLNPITYAPGDLVVPNVPLRNPGSESMQIRQVTAVALEAMLAAAKQDGLNLMLTSGYRSYQVQSSTYDSEVQGFGQAHADTESARPGYSEHQTGLAVDLEPASHACELDQCFATTPEGSWLAANAYKFGFLIRYTADKEQVTGYKYEPWHVRYVGAELAAQLHSTGTKTLEEFFGLPGGPNYKT